MKKHKKRTVVACKQNNSSVTSINKILAFFKLFVKEHEGLYAFLMALGIWICGVIVGVNWGLVHG